jgi:hypothetical protein
MGFVFACVLALVYSVDCLCAVLHAWRRRRFACPNGRGGRRDDALFAVAAAGLILGALGVLCSSAVPRTASAVALLAGAAFAGAGYIAARRIPFARLNCRRDEPRRQHPWPLDPVPSAARTVTRPAVMTMALPALGSVVELNQN